MQTDLDIFSPMTIIQYLMAKVFGMSISMLDALVKLGMWNYDGMLPPPQASFGFPPILWVPSKRVLLNPQNARAGPNTKAINRDACGGG